MESSYHASSRRASWITGLAATALLTLTSLVACSNNATPVNAPVTNGGAPINVQDTVAVPTFPPVTVGAFVSNQTPALGDNIIVYAFVRGHTYSTPGNSPPAQAIAGATVRISGGVPDQSGVTGKDGIAAFNVNVTQNPGVPIVINVTANANNTVARTTTFFSVQPTSYNAPTPSATPGK